MSKNEIQNEKKCQKTKKSKNDDYFILKIKKSKNLSKKILFTEIIRNNGAATVIRIRRFNSSSQIMHFTNEFMYCICKQKEKQTNKIKKKTSNQPLKQSIFR